MTDAAVVLLRKKMSGKYTLFKVGHDVLAQPYSVIGT